ncbi:MAG TPA: hypothetical protein VIL37_11370 [Natronosporangium sp.]
MTLVIGLAVIFVAAAVISAIVNADRAGDQMATCHLGYAERPVTRQLP